MTALEKREISFARIVSTLMHRPTPLACCVLIPPLEFKLLRQAVLRYLEQSLPISSSTDVLHRLVRDRDQILTITPGGIVVPKRNSVLEYNLVARTFAEIVGGMIGPLIGSWHIPPNVRVKYEDIPPKQLTRARPSERPHSDAWAGESPQSVTVHIPLFGDTVGNYVRIYAPPRDFEESWLVPLDSDDVEEVAQYETELASRYSLVNFKCPLGSALFLDAALMHASTRLLPCSVRVSIEAPFVWFDAEQKPWLSRANEHAPPSVLLGLGATHLLYFGDDQKVHRQTTSLQHVANLRVVRL